MPCYIQRTRDGGKLFVCGDLGPHCADCAAVGDLLCDFPVGEGKTCDRPMCATHASEIGPELHYCRTHVAMWEAYRDGGGVGRELANVVAFPRKPDTSPI